MGITRRSGVMNFSRGISRLEVFARDAGNKLGQREIGGRRIQERQVRRKPIDTTSSKRKPGNHRKQKQFRERDYC